ncbi:MAG: type II toxin-antitoxin system RelE/ParE family toxin [Gallionella sp.]|nr:type II toxin-antitoxin system RelE/ParE family toxin [Gallionella sp.]
MNYRFHPKAAGEHYDHVAFYEVRLPGLGADYLAEFEAAMAHICRSPRFSPKIAEPNIHKAGLKRFPFHVIYRVESTQVLVLAIAHQRRRPVYWSGRVLK